MGASPKAKAIARSRHVESKGFPSFPVCGTMVLGPVDSRPPGRPSGAQSPGALLCLARLLGFLCSLSVCLFLLLQPGAGLSSGRLLLGLPFLGLAL